MEDILTTESSYSKTDLASFARHMVVFEVEAMLTTKITIDNLINDTTKSKDQIKIEVQALFDTMSHAWNKLGPARALARRLYPDLMMFFDILDKSLCVREALDDMRHGREFRKDEPCVMVCCKKMLKQSLEGNGNGKE